MKAGKAAATTVMPLISAALYLAQFLSPVLMSAVNGVFGGTAAHLPYCLAAVLAVLFLLWSALIPTERKRERPEPCAIVSRLLPPPHRAGSRGQKTVGRAPSLFCMPAGRGKRPLFSGGRLW